MAIMPSKLDGIVSNRLDFQQFRLRNGNKFPLRSMALAERAWAITSEIRFGVFACVAIVPFYFNHAVGLSMIDLNWVMRIHDFYILINLSERPSN